MAALDAEARAALDLTERIADAFVGAVFAGGSSKEAENRLASLAVDADHAVQGDMAHRESLNARARRDLALDASGGRPRRPFHWPLEYPEVFQRHEGGFDAFVGNPPFLGGQHITGVAGTAYREWLVEVIAAGRRGSSDLVAYFFLRVAKLLRPGGHFGLLAINTIAEGDTRRVGLDQLLANGAVIHAAYPDESWPGRAAVSTSRVHARNGPWRGERLLQGSPTSFISAYLSDREEWNPRRLNANDGFAFQGAITLGMGFVITPDEAAGMLEADPKNEEVIFPYLNGQDLNSDPEQRPSRWVINFWDWPEDRAKEYRLPYEWLEKHVLPDRMNNNDIGARERWWRFLRPRPELYHTIGRGHHFEQHPRDWDSQSQPMARVIAFATQASKYPVFSFVYGPIVFSNALGIFATQDAARLAELSSSLHNHWAFTHGGSLETRLRYAPHRLLHDVSVPRTVSKVTYCPRNATRPATRGLYEVN